MAKTLYDLVDSLEISAEDAQRYKDTEITAVVYDSRKLVEGCLFICIKGAKFDGHDAIPEAIDKKAAAILVEGIPEAAVRQCQEAGIACIICPDTRAALAYVSAEWFDHPADKLFTIGITGTKGKTTTAYLVRNTLNGCLMKCGLIGTVEVDTGSRSVPAKNTTPESYELQQYMAEMVKNKCAAVVMEVSSQGLMMHRTEGFVFDIAVFTNISPDHIGPNEHKDFADYLHCKSLLFQQAELPVCNADDEHAEEVLGVSMNKSLSYGIEHEGCTFNAKELKPYRDGGVLGTALKLIKEGGDCKEVKIPQPGRFSVYNALAAYLTVVSAMGIILSERSVSCWNSPEVDSDNVLDTLLCSMKVKGRLETIPVSDDYTLMIDYAHNAMALDSLLSTLKEYHPERIVTLFGCGGNRAKARRYEMGEVSGRLSDLTIITSDNPRDEEPMAIIEDIITGIKKTDGKYVTVPDRKEAIRYAIQNAKKGDIIILAGKGHEDYQEIKGVKHPMDERRLILEILKEDGDRAAYERVAKQYPELAEE